MKNLLILNGVNLNMLGMRERSIYGEKTYGDLVSYIMQCAAEANVNVDVKQTNYEGELVEFIQRAYGVYDGIVINAGAYTHTSIAVLDALKAVNIPTVEVHLTDIDNREDFRKFSFVSLFAIKRIVGKGFDGYKEAMEYLVKHI